MELIHVFVEFSSLGRDIFERLIIIAVALGFKAYFACDLELVENIALTHFVRMKFKAERRDADLLQTLIYDVQCSLFLGREKNFLAVCKTVRDYRCDGL